VGEWGEAKQSVLFVAKKNFRDEQVGGIALTCCKKRRQTALTITVFRRERKVSIDGEQEGKLSESPDTFLNPEWGKTEVEKDITTKN